MSKFNVGDRVRVVQYVPSRCWGAPRVGDEGVIVAVYSKMCLVGFEFGDKFVPLRSLELAAHAACHLTALESRVEALEGRADAVLKLVTEMDEGDEGMEGRVRALADRLVVLERAAFVRALPPEPNMGDEIIRGLTELRDMLRDRTVPDCNCGEQDRPDHSPHKDCCRVYTNEARPKPASELRRGEVEYLLPGWQTTSNSAAWWVEDKNYTRFRRTDTTPPQEITKAEFVQALLPPELRGDGWYARVVVERSE